MAGSIAAGCSTDSGSSAPREITADAVAGRATAALTSTITMRAEASLRSSYEDQSAEVGRSESEVDLRAGIVTGESWIDLGPSDEDGEILAEETVVLPDRSYRRGPGEPWERSSQPLTEVVLPAFEEEGDDLALAVRAVVLTASEPWTATTGDDGTTTYRSAESGSGETLDLEIDDQGRLSRLARSQPPFGSERDGPMRVGVEIVFSEFDSTVVELPPDLPEE